MTDQAQQQDRLEKIRALLAKAEATAFPEEAKTFAAKAQELMAKWAIDDAMLEHGKDVRGDIDQLDIWIAANEFRGPKIRLLADLADLNDCKSIMFSQTYRIVDGKRLRQFRFGVVGHKADREFVQTLFTSLLLQAEMELLRPDTMQQMEIDCVEGGHRIRWRNSFMMGYAAEIRRRLKLAKDRAREQAAQQYQPQTMAMVLVGKMALVERRFTELYPKLCKGRGSDCGSGFAGAHQSGRLAASRADLGSPKVGSRTRGVLT